MSRNPGPTRRGSVLVVGGGIGGIQTSLDLADQGFKVYLVERGPSIGGKMVQLDKTFPTNDCAMCMISPKLVTCARHPNIEILTLAEVASVAGAPGRFGVTVHLEPRSVDAAKCTGCGTCMEECPVRNIVVVPPAGAGIASREETGRDPFALSPEREAKLNALLERYPEKAAACLPALHLAQEEHGFVDPAVIEFVARTLEIPVSRVEAVARFYSMVQPSAVGRYHLRICTNLSCSLLGADHLREAIELELGIRSGETTADGLFTLDEVECLASCGTAPVMQVNERLHEALTPDSLKRLVADLRAEAARGA